MEKYFSLDDPAFENSFYTNGQAYWYASEFIKWLGYKEYTPTMPPISRAMSVCISIPTILMTEHFREEARVIDGKNQKDFKLSRFACYLVSMNADVKKIPVAKAQAYFAAFAATIQEYVRSSEDIERVSLRKEISEHEKSLASTAKHSGVEQYAFFANKGYMGLYNMPIAQLRERKNIPPTHSPLDYMGAEELGANIFRITQTDAKIKREKLKGQRELESAAFHIGKTVRDAIVKTGGTMPENLQAEVHVDKIKSELKKTSKEFSKKDKKLIEKKK